MSNKTKPTVYTLAFSRMRLKEASIPGPLGKSPQRWASHLVTGTRHLQCPPETEDRGLQAAHPDVPQVLRSSMNGPALSDPLGRALPSDFNRRGLFPSSVSRVP